MDLNPGQILAEHDASRFDDFFEFSANGDLIVFNTIDSTGDTEKIVVTILDASTGHPRYTVSHPGVAVAFHPGGTHVAVRPTTRGKDFAVIDDLASGVSSKAMGPPRDLNLEMPWYALNVWNLHAFFKSNDQIVSLLSTVAIRTVQLWNFNTGEELGRLSVHGSIHEARLSSDEGHLVCDEGRVPIPTMREDLHSARMSGARECLYVADDWVICGFEKLVWLPPSYRSPIVVCQQRVALKDARGTVLYMNIDLGKIPWAGAGEFE